MKQVVCCWKVQLGGSEMNWLDIVLLIIIIKSALQGYFKGFVLAAFKTAGVIVSLFMGIFYRDEAVSFLKAQLAMDRHISSMMLSPAMRDLNTLGVANIRNIIDLMLAAVGFLLIFLLAQVIFLVPAYLISGIVKLSNLSLFDRLLGGLFGIARAALWLALLSAVTSPFLLLFPGSILDRGISSSYILNHLRFLDFISPIVVKLI